MTLFLLKWIATITMSIDHIGVHIINEGIPCEILRCIGRLAFPLYAYFITQGFKHTSNRIRYLLRLLILAAGTQVVLIIAQEFISYPGLLRENIFATLLAGLCCIMVLRDRRWYINIICLPILALVGWLRPDYSVYGVLLIIMFEFADGNLLKIFGFALINLIFIVFVPKIGWAPISRLSMPYSQWFSMLAMLPIMFYNGLYGVNKHKRFWQYFFYAYYPVHIVIILIIAQLI